jgi:orotate phosphoribosyltransferase
MALTVQSTNLGPDPQHVEEARAWLEQSLDDLRSRLLDRLNDLEHRHRVTALLIDELRREALEETEVTLSSGLKASYYIDAKRTILTPIGALATGLLVAYHARQLGATAVGGLTIGADPVACGALAPGDRLKAFLVRKHQKEHGLQKWIEGPVLAPGERCLIVDDVVTTGGSVIDAINRVHEEGLVVVGVVSVLDRLAGGRERIEAAAPAPYIPLTTIDDVYPERPDR